MPGAKFKMKQMSFVSINKASEILGVSEAALRQWTDGGKIKAFITPGGHRRFLKSDLKKLLDSNQRYPGLKDLALEVEDTIQIHREIGKSFHNTSWYSRLDVESQEYLARLGRQLLDLIITFITKPTRQAETEKLICKTGQDFGLISARLDLQLADSVEAFILHRNPIMNTATELIKKRGVFTDRIVETIPLLGRVLDSALVALVSTHQRYQETKFGTG